MYSRLFWLAAAALLMVAPSVPAQPVLPELDREPILRLEASGPTAFVTAVVFGPDGKSLYAAGFDKVVRVWTLDAKTGQFTLDRAATYRVPIGPGLEGAINCLALSSDGDWLAVAGRGPFRGAAGRQPGWWVPSSTLTDAQLQDQGMIYLFHTRRDEVRLLRGHHGSVHALAFAPLHEGKPPLLVSAGREAVEKGSRHVGTVRVWDVDRSEQIAVLRDLPDLYVPPTAKRREEFRRPGLAVRHSGKQLRQLQVALAWGDGTFRVWNVAGQDGKLQTAEDGSFNTTVAFLSDDGPALTGSYRAGEGGRLQLWTVVPDRAPQPGAAAIFRAEGPNHFAPWLLGLFPAKAGGTLNRVAVVQQVASTADKGRSYRLQLLSVSPRAIQVRSEPIPLWPAQGQGSPALAVAPTGAYLAIAGDRDHQIALYAIQEGQAPVLQPLRPVRGEGVTHRYVSFAVNGKELGLVLSTTGKTTMGGPPRPLREGDSIYVFRKDPILSEDHTGWKVSAPAVAKEDVEYSPAQLPEEPRSWLGVRLADGKKRWTPLRPGQKVTDYALLPAGPFPVPVLAVAYLDEFGQPNLALFNAASGEKIRQLSGHQGTIRSLAFSADGKLLASAADDQVVSIWGLFDLDKILNQRGWLQDVVVEKGADGLVVVGVPAQSKLERGSIVRGLVEDGKLRPLETTKEFYAAFAPLKPGSVVTLQVRTPGGVEQPLKMWVNQVVDERKPLLSLFVTRSGARGGAEWVAWSPIGPYEASDRLAERHIGWHINTGQAKAPTTFARADEYRDRYYRPGVARQLVERGIFVEPPPPPPKRPAIGLRIDEGGAAPAEAEGRVVLRDPRAILKLMLRDYDGPVHSAHWRLDDGPWQAFEQPLGGTWDADLSRQDWRRGPHQLSVALRTRADQEPPCTAELALVYRPRAPVVQVAGPENRHTEVPGFSLQAEVRPGLPGQAVQVRLLHRHNGETSTVREWDKIDQPLKIDEKVRLRPGVNYLDVVAVNRDAPRGGEEAETTRRSIIVNLGKTPPPVITLDAVETPAGDRLPIEQGRVVVKTPRVRLLGKVSGPVNLDAAWWVRDGAKKEEKHALAGFTPQRLKELAIREELALKPGEQTFRFHARTVAEIDAAPVTVTIAYRPPLPELAVDHPPPDETVLYEGEKMPDFVVLKAGQPEFLLQARLTPAADNQEFERVIVRNGEELALRATVDEVARTLSARVPLVPGENRIQVRLRNQWKESSLSEPPVVLSYLRPPRFVGEPVAKPHKLDTDLEARIRSATPLKPFLKVIDDAGQERLLEAERNPPAKGAAEPLWLVRLKGVPLPRQGKNTLRLLAENADGWSLQPGTVTVTAVAPPRPPQVVLTPAANFTTNNRTTTLRVEVRSELPPRVLLTRTQAETVPLEEVAVKPARQAGVYEGETTVELLPGVNQLQVRAVTASGEGWASVSANYLEQPVRLLIDRVEVKGQPDKAVLPQPGPNKTLVFPRPVPVGHVVIHGHVEWLASRDKLLEDQKAEVRALVNGFRQPPRPLGPRVEGGRTRPFRLEVVLNKTFSNLIEIELPALPQDAGNRSQFTLDCLKPEQRKQVHVLIVAPGVRDRDKVKADVLKSIQAEATSASGFRCDPLTSGQIYGPLTEDVTAERVGTLLESIRYNIELASRRGPSNDVVLIYYQGRWSSALPGRRPPPLTREDLGRFATWAAGAKLALLDVAPVTAATGREKSVFWDEEARYGVFCFARPDPAVLPSEGRLLTALDQAMDRGKTLGEIERRLDARYQEVERKYPKVLSYHHRLPAGLNELVLSGLVP